MKIISCLLGVLVIAGSTMADEPSNNNQAANAVATDQMSNGAPNGCPNSYDPCPMMYDPCCDSWWSNLAVSGYVDYLYWKTSRSDLFYRNSEGYRYLDPTHNSNFRVGLYLGCDCYDFGVRYTRIHNHDRKSGNDYQIKFDMIDFETGYNLSFDCIDATFKPFAGVKLLWSQQDWEDEFRDNFNAVGLYMGIESKWLLCSWDVCCNQIPISLLFRSSCGILEGTNDYHDDDGKEHLFTFANDVFVGLNFDIEDCKCFDGSIAVGYEAQNYTNWAQFLGFSGLVVRFGASF